MDPELVRGFVSFVIFLIVVVFVMFIVFVLLFGIVEFLRNAFSSPPVYRHTQMSQPTYFPSRPSRKLVAIDTEMVGAGDRGQINMLARVSLVNKYGECIYDEHVAPILPVTDYRTFVSGIRKEDLIDAKLFSTVQREVRNIIEDCILVGHDLKNDLAAIGLAHPPQHIRDTAFYIPIREDPNLKPSLKFLALKYLGRFIQLGEHSPIEDARAAMDIYLKFASRW